MIDIKLLLNNPLFKNMDETTLSHLLALEQCIIGNYKKRTLLVQEGDPCTSLGIVISGTLAIQQITVNGDILTINMFEAGDVFGAALLSVEPSVYPFTLTTVSNSQVLYLPFYEIQKLLKCSPTFNDNYISFLSTRVITFKDKLRMLHSKDVRSRLIYYLSNEYTVLETPVIRLRHSKIAIADILGVARPSVSRELKHMADENMIELSENTITLLKPELFCK